MESRPEILKHANDVYWAQFNYHREKEYRLFVWTSTIMIGSIAALFVKDGNSQTLLDIYGIKGRMFATVCIVGWAMVSCSLQIRERMHGDRYAGVLVRIATELKLFEPVGADVAPVLPKSWVSWESEENPKLSRLYLKNYLPVTMMLSLISGILIWA